MAHNKKPMVREVPRRLPLGVITVSTLFGILIGWGSTYYFMSAPKTAAPPAAAPAPQAQAVTMTPQQKFTPAPQPPGEPPPGKVWSVEHGHWHDAPAVTPTAAGTPGAVTVTPTPAPAPPPAIVNPNIPFVSPGPAIPAPAPAATPPAGTPPAGTPPAEKK